MLLEGRWGTIRIEETIVNLRPGNEEPQPNSMPNDRDMDENRTYPLRPRNRSRSPRNGAKGKGRGKNTCPKPKHIDEARGDWKCECGNWNYFLRDQCNVRDCQKEHPNPIPPEQKKEIIAKLRSKNITFMDGSPSLQQKQEQDAIAVKEGRKIFVGGLSDGVSNKMLRRAFEEFGEVIDCSHMKHKASGLSRGFGFVTMACPVKAQTVILNSKSITLGSKRLWLELSDGAAPIKRLNDKGENIQLIPDKEDFVDGIDTLITEENQARVVYIVKLPKTVNTEYLTLLCQQAYGAVESTNMNKRVGCALVIFKEEKSAQEAVESGRMEIDEDDRAEIYSKDTLPNGATYGGNQNMGGSGRLQNTSEARGDSGGENQDDYLEEPREDYLEEPREDNLEEPRDLDLETE